MFSFQPKVSKLIQKLYILAAQNSSRSLVVRWSVGLSGYVCEIVPFWESNGTKIYLPLNLCDSSDISDSNDSSDSCDSSDRSDSSNSSDQKWHFFYKLFFQKKSVKISKNQIVMKLKNSNCDETQKQKLWWN